MKNLKTIELGIAGNGKIYRNLSVPALVEQALLRGEGRLSDTGALAVNTGKYTGRSPDDKFIVDTASVHDEIAWGKINVPISEERFAALKAKVVAYLQNKDLFVFDGFAGADAKYRQNFRIVNELASQNLFIRDLLIRPTEAELDAYMPDYTVIAAPGFKCIPAVDFQRWDCRPNRDRLKAHLVNRIQRFKAGIIRSFFHNFNDRRSIDESVVG